ncbi:hypothetical protein [Undibacterium terreum]|uniref:Uncharacterized protein n=1 Tax=Undibacterium terreum TaxID=1224302 RepID=A0A916XR87_9BURK|nr:hypothetical protein [Undibacterium terreum]GGD00895.1 hypothetical protein GCM10011396_55600 [Undibacterium terreum]
MNQLALYAVLGAHAVGCVAYTSTQGLGTETPVAATMPALPSVRTALSQDDVRLLRHWQLLLSADTRPQYVA